MIDWRAAEGLAARPARPRPGGVPGEPGIWVVVAADLGVFGLFFAVFVHERGRDVAGFDHARRTLNLAVGTIGTLSLLVGSMLVVAGASALRRGRHTVAARAFRLTLACGAVFAAMKAVEYVHQATAGHTPSTNPFYMYFYVLSGIHLVHVAVATVLVMLMRAVARRPAADARGLRFVESAAIFWHLVDLLWLMLFALFYLMR